MIDRYLFACMASLAVLGFSTASQAATPSCRNLKIDDVWSGNSVGLAAISTAESVYVGYYNKDRFLSLAQVDTKTCAIKRKVLPNQYAGWDLHNYITLHIDRLTASVGQQSLHISGNMHNVPLVYFRTNPGRDISTTLSRTMVGQQENSVTYPKFLNVADDQSVFFYRNGASGDGSWYANLWNGKAWSRKTSSPIYGNKFFNGKSFETVNAYPNGYILGSDNYYHVVIVWRKTPDVDSNFRISYVKTKEFQQWSSVSGEKLGLPIEAHDKATVLDLGTDGTGKGLVNNAQIALDLQGKPVISYTRYVGSGAQVRNGIYVAQYTNGEWVSQLVATSNVWTPVKGRGTMTALPSGSTVRFYSNVAQITVSFPGEASRTISLDPVTLKPITGTPPKPIVPPGPATPSRPTPSPYPAEPLVATPQIDRLVAAPLAGDTNAPYAVLQWRNQGRGTAAQHERGNLDRPRICETSGTPEERNACQPKATPLILDIN